MNCLQILQRIRCIPLADRLGVGQINAEMVYKHCALGGFLRPRKCGQSFGHLAAQSQTLF